MAFEQAEFVLTRAPRPEDAAAVAGLLNMCAMAETGGLQTTVAQVRQSWESGGFDLSRDAWVLVNQKEEIVGYAELWSCYPYVAAYVCIRVHPDHAGGRLAEHLLELAEARARQVVAKAPREARTTLCAATVSVNQSARRLFYQHGFALARRYWQAGQRIDPSPAALCLPGSAAGDAAQGEHLLYRYDLYEKELRAGLE